MISKRILQLMMTGWIVLLAFALIQVSCTGGHARTSGSNQHENHADLSNLAQNTSQLNDPAKMKLQPVFLNKIRTTGSQYEKNLVTDGSLTLDEYEKAELAYASCMQAAGYKIHPGSTDLNGLDTIDVAVGPFSNVQAEQKDKAICKGKYTDAIEIPWVSLTGAIAQHVENEARTSMTNCIKSADLKPGPGWIRSGPTDDGQQIKFNACLDATATKYDIDDSFGFDGDENLPIVPANSSGQ